MERETKELDESTEVFMFTNTRNMDTSVSEASNGSPSKPLDKQPSDYIITGYNLETEEDIRSKQAKMEMLKNINSKQVELQSKVT